MSTFFEDIKLKNHVREMEDTVKNLEDNFQQSKRTDNKVIVSLHTDKIKYQGLREQLDEALRENKQLLDVLHQKCGDSTPDASRKNSQIDLSSSCSTMSIVHLQYKYEELLASHHALLKLLETKSAEIRRFSGENTELKTEIERLRMELAESDQRIAKLQDKFTRIKERKDAKIKKLRINLESLQMVQNQLAELLHKQCMEKDNALLGQIKNCPHAEKALLLQEIRKNNLLVYENFQLSQMIGHLKSTSNKHEVCEKLHK